MFGLCWGEEYLDSFSVLENFRKIRFTYIDDGEREVKVGCSGVGGWFYGFWVLLWKELLVRIFLGVLVIGRFDVRLEFRGI